MDEKITKEGEGEEREKMTNNEDYTRKEELKRKDNKAEGTTANDWTARRREEKRSKTGAER